MTNTPRGSAYNPNITRETVRFNRNRQGYHIQFNRAEAADPECAMGSGVGYFKELKLLNLLNLDKYY
jgi:hypothetical protein